MKCRLTHIGTATAPLEAGPIRFTSNAGDAVRIVRALNPGWVIPIQYEGWAHFRELKGKAGDISHKLACRIGYNGCHWTNRWTLPYNGERSA